MQPQLLASLALGSLLGAGPAPAFLLQEGGARGAAEALFNELELRRIRMHSPLPPPPPDPTNRVADDPEAAHFGRYLFFETKFSADRDVSCATCHVPSRGFADGLRRRWIQMRHTTSVWNAAYQRWFFWDGRADSLWSQALQSIEEPIEFRGDRLQVAHALDKDPALRAGYEAVFGPLPDFSDARRFPRAGRPAPENALDPLHASWSAMQAEDRATVERVFADVGKALAAYERTLTGGRSRFDVFVEGLGDGDPEKLAQLSPSARRGLALFVGKANCRLCHAGPAFSDGEFHSIGVAPLGGGAPADPGRLAGLELLRADPFSASGPYSDDRTGEAARALSDARVGGEAWGQFRTPSLRNVALTAPYMHQGQFETLTAVVRFYSRREGSTPAGHHQEQVLKPLGLSAAEEQDLVSFLESLTDPEPDANALRRPASPIR